MNNVSNWVMTKTRIMRGLTHPDAVKMYREQGSSWHSKDWNGQKFMGKTVEDVYNGFIIERVPLGNAMEDLADCFDGLCARDVSFKEVDK